MPRGKKPKPFFAPLSEEDTKALYRQHYRAAVKKHSSTREIMPQTPGEHRSVRTGEVVLDSSPEGKDTGYYTIACMTCHRTMFIEGTPTTAYGYVHGDLQSHVPCTRTKEPTHPTVVTIHGASKNA